MILSFVYPSPPEPTAGVVVLYELANSLARRGHVVHFLHGPAWPTRITRLEDLQAFPFDPRIEHHLTDMFDERTLPHADIVFHWDLPQLGLPVNVVQGFRMLPLEWELIHYRAAVPKICVATWLIDVGLRLGVPPEQLWYLPLGLDHEMFALRTPLDQRPFDVAMLYHPHRQKGSDLGLLVLHELRRQHRDLRVIIFGMVEPAEPVPEGVRFVKAPDHRALARDVYNQARVFLQPSLHEGFGYTAVEAMACGSALVTTDNGGSRDYAVAGETAVVVPAGDVGALVAGVNEVLRDDGLRLRLARAGERYVQRFDWDRTALLLEGLLESYLADPERFQHDPAATYALEDL